MPVRSRSPGCRRRFRLLVWNVQQKDARRASDVLTRSVLAYAAARGFDAVALNEVWHEEQDLLALSTPLGYPHAALHRGRLGSRLGLLSSAPLSIHPVRHIAGHGAICAGPLANSSSSSSSSNSDAGGDGTPDAPPIVCVAHLSPGGETARLSELPSLLGALPTKQPALLVGDLNALSPLDFASSAVVATTNTTTFASAPATSAPASASAASLSPAALRVASTLATQLRASRKLTKKYLNASAQPALRVMGMLLKAGLRDLTHLASHPAGALATPTWSAGGGKRAPTPEEEELARVDDAPPPPPPVASATGIASSSGAGGGPALRIDYALANAALFSACRSPLAAEAATSSTSHASAGWGAWAAVIPHAELEAHGVGSVSEHAPIQVTVGEGAPQGVNAVAYEAAAAIQQVAGAEAAAGASPLATVASSRSGGSKPAGVERLRPAAQRSFGGEDAAQRIGGGAVVFDEADIESMPGGTPFQAGNASGGGGGGGGGARCDELGSGRAKGLARLKSEVGSSGAFARRCQALSGVLKLLKLSRRLRTCAVVGGSGILRQHPRGGEIDAHEAIFRVNNCPVGGFEGLVGSRTSVRFLNGPRSIMWGRQIAQQSGSRARKPPPELEHNDHVVVWGDAGTRDRLASALPRNASIVRANTKFRRECADKTFWSAEELDRHRASNGVPRLEITFGFEAVAHALYACERVAIYGFFLDHDDAQRQTNAATSGSGKAMEVPYHYYENQTYDKSAKDPWRPWTYKFHNFELEHQKFAQLRHACWLNVVTD